MSDSNVPNVDEAESGDALPDSKTALPISGPDAPRGHWGLWIAAGFLGAIVCTLTVGWIAKYGVVMDLSSSKESSAGDGMEISPEELAAMRANVIANIRRLLYAVGVSLTLVFSIFGGIRYRNLGRGLVGFVIGSLVVSVVSFGMGGVIADLETRANMSPQQVDYLGMILHSIQWLVISTGPVVAIGWITKSISVGLKALLLFGLAAALGGVGYIMGGGLVDPQNASHLARPSLETSLYLWSALPPIAAGLFLARAQA